MSRRAAKPAETKPLVRCAIYTRKSTEEGLEQEFNSLDAQRESAEAYITAQKHEGFDPLWEQLSPAEQARILQLLIERIDYDGKSGTVSITFHPSGIKTLAEQQGHEAAA